LAEQGEDPLIFQLRRNLSDTAEAGPMKKLHVSTTALRRNNM
jgi:hypothetical protein